MASTDDDRTLDFVFGRFNRGWDVGSRTVRQRITRVPRVTEWPDDSYTGVPDPVVRASFGPHDEEAERWVRQLNRAAAAGRRSQWMAKENAQFLATLEQRMTERAATLERRKVERAARPPRPRGVPLYRRRTFRMAVEDAARERQRAEDTDELLSTAALAEAWRERQRDRAQREARKGKP